MDTQTLTLTPYEAHSLIKAVEAINSSHVSGTGEFMQEEMDACRRLTDRLSPIAGDVTEPEVDKVWLVPVTLHVVADSAELAVDHVAQVCDKGEVRLEVEGDSFGVIVLYANTPEDGVVAAPYHYEDGNLIS